MKENRVTKPKSKHQKWFIVLSVAEVNGSTMFQVEENNQYMICQAQSRLYSLCGSNDNEKVIASSQHIILSCMDTIRCISRYHLLITIQPETLSRTYKSMNNETT